MNTTKLKDLPVSDQPIWFKEKKYGYGWTPASKAGWTALAVMIMFQIINSIFLVIQIGDDKPFSVPVIQYIFLTFAFLVGISTLTTLTGTPLKRIKFFGKK